MVLYKRLPDSKDLDIKKITTDELDSISFHKNIVGLDYKKLDDLLIDSLHLKSGDVFFRNFFGTIVSEGDIQLSMAKRKF